MIKAVSSHHTIGFIEDEVRDLTQTDLTSLEKVIEPPWGGNSNLDPIAQVAELRALWSSSVKATGEQKRKRVRED